ncbi:MAG: hypothetical protein EBQ92_00430 [Proteobacteria bacterium]|nr:hypothetical protein [Pseudomonadota bacterium]
MNKPNQSDTMEGQTDHQDAFTKAQEECRAALAALKALAPDDPRHAEALAHYNRTKQAMDLALGPALDTMKQKHAYDLVTVWMEALQAAQKKRHELQDELQRALEFTDEADQSLQDLLKENVFASHMKNIDVASKEDGRDIRRMKRLHRELNENYEEITQAVAELEKGAETLEEALNLKEKISPRALLLEKAETVLKRVRDTLENATSLLKKVNQENALGEALESAKKFIEENGGSCQSE